MRMTDHRPHEVTNLEKIRRLPWSIATNSLGHFGCERLEYLVLALHALNGTVQLQQH